MRELDIITASLSRALQIARGIVVVVVDYLSDVDDYGAVLHTKQIILRTGSCLVIEGEIENISIRCLRNHTTNLTPNKMCAHTEDCTIR